MNNDAQSKSSADSRGQASSAVVQSAYMPGFGNDFETEALPGALPQGMNSPQPVSYTHLTLPTIYSV